MVSFTVTIIVTISDNRSNNVERKELVKVAKSLDLVFKGNAKTTLITGLVEAKVASLNSILKPSEKPPVITVTVSPSKVITSRGVHPITGEAV